MIFLRIHILVLAGAMLLTAGLFAADDETVTSAPPAAETGFESFNLIFQRNIFNQNRSPRSSRRDSPRSRPTPVVHALSLVGTMSYEKGNFAFFDGTRPEYKKPVKSGEKIAGYEIREINPSCVTLVSDDQQFQLKVGQQLRREDEGEWEISTSGSRVDRERGGPESAPVEATSPTGSASEDEALKRLLEKRAKEMNE